MSLPYDEKTIREAIDGQGVFSTCFTYGVVGDDTACDIFAAFGPDEMRKGDHHDVLSWFKLRAYTVQAQEQDHVKMWFVEGVTPQQAFEFSLRWCGAPYEPDTVRCAGT